MDTELLSLLPKFGYADKEAAVYAALLELGQATVTTISKQTKLKRSIIYVVIGSLLERGTVTEVPRRAVATYQAVDPSIILTDIKKAVTDFTEMLPFWQSLRSKQSMRPKMHFIDSEEGILAIYNKMFDTKDGEFITSYTRMDEHLPGSVNAFLARMKKGAIRLQGKNLLPETREERIIGEQMIKQKQYVRYLPKGIDVGMDFAISGDLFAITLLEKNPSLVLFESKELAASMRSLFNLLWETAKK